MDVIGSAPVPDLPRLAPETREEMFRAFQRIAESRLTNGPDFAAWRRPIFEVDKKDELLAKLHACSDEEFLEVTRAFLEECGHSRRGTNGARLVFAQCFMDDLREGLRDVDEPLDPEVLSLQVEGYRELLESYRTYMPNFGVPLEESDEKNLRQLAKKVFELTRHLVEMNYYIENRGQGDLVVALIYKIEKLLDIPKTFAFAQMTLHALLGITEQFTLVEDRYGFKFADYVDPHLRALQTRLEVHAGVVENATPAV